MNVPAWSSVVPRGWVTRLTVVDVKLPRETTASSPPTSEHPELLEPPPLGFAPTRLWANKTYRNASRIAFTALAVRGLATSNLPKLFALMTSKSAASLGSGARSADAVQGVKATFET